MAITKTDLRESMRRQRDTLSSGQRVDDGQAIAEKLFALPEFIKARTVAFFLSIASEVNTRWMVEQAIVNGKKVLVPITRNEIELADFPGWDNLQLAQFGVPEPIHPKRSSVVPEIIIVPGLAFDQRGHRLGYGKGYYDRLLKGLDRGKTMRIGIAFDFQLMDRIPTTRDDEKMDRIVTEKRVVKIHG